MFIALITSRQCYKHSQSLEDVLIIVYSQMLINFFKIIIKNFLSFQTGINKKFSKMLHIPGALCLLSDPFWWCGSRFGRIQIWIRNRFSSKCSKLLRIRNTYCATTATHTLLYCLVSYRVLAGRSIRYE